ncbi:MAG: trehalose-phosphatase [Candidatus Omnitrophota bacterium]
MQYLLNSWDKLKEELKNRFIVLFLDFDGTLTPIADRPDMAKLSLEVKSILHKIVNKPNHKLCIISGRAINDLKEKIGIKDIIYVGNHGLEMEGPKIKFESRIAIEIKRVIEDMRDKITDKFSNVRGILIEDKNLSFAVHYRMCDRKDIDYIKSEFDKISHEYLLHDKIEVLYGKEVIDIRPKSIWDKGKIVLWLLARFRFIIDDKQIEPFYIGDDITDEYAFEALKDKEFTIFVGSPKQSSAKYYLRNPAEVIELLRSLIEV